jgi:hypothetical protein
LSEKSAVSEKSACAVFAVGLYTASRDAAPLNRQRWLKGKDGFHK